MLANPLFWCVIFALFAKIWCGYRLWQAWEWSLDVALFLVLIYLQTLIELFSVYALEHPGMYRDVGIAKAYYVVFTSILIILPGILMTVVYKKYHILLLVHIMIAVVIAIVTIATDSIVAGAIRLEHTLSAIPGEHYWWFQLISYATMFQVLGMTWFIYTKSNSEFNRIRAMNIFIGFAQYVLMIGGVIFLKMLGVKMSAVGIASISMAIFIFIFAENIKRDRVLDFRVFIPWTKAYRDARAVMKPFVYASNDLIPTKQLSKKYEQKLAESACRRFGSRKIAAEYLGISEPTLSRLLKSEKL